MVRSRKYIVLAVAVVASLAGAAPASAAKFCVNTEICPAGSMKPTVEEAIDATELNGQADTVLIGPSKVPYTGAFSSTSGEKLTIDGAGIGETILEGTQSTNTTLTVAGNAESSISDLTIRVRDVDVIGLNLYLGTATRVRVEQDGTETDLSGVKLRHAVFEDGEISMNGGTGVEVTNDDTQSAIRDSTIRSWVGVTTRASATTTISRTRVISQRSALQSTGTGTTTVENSTLRRYVNQHDCTVSGLMGTVIANHVTIVGPGLGYGVCSSGYNAYPTTVTLKSSIVTNHQIDLIREVDVAGDATLGASYSSFASSKDFGGGGGGALTLGAGNVTVVTPEFVNPLLGGYYLDAPSPLMDKGDPTEVYALDLEGNPRVIDGRADMGAYEYQHRAPVAAAVVPATANVGESVEVTGSGSKDLDPGDELTYAWDFGDGATATGFKATHAWAAAGTRTVTLRVTDPTGLETTVAKQIAIVGPPVDGGGAGGGQGGGAAGGEAGGAGPGGGSAVLTALAVSPGKIRAGKAAALKVTLSAPATLRLRYQRLLPGRTKASRCVAPAKAKRQAKRCTRSVVVGAPLTLAAAAGETTADVPRAVRRKPGRYRVTVDGAGPAKATTFTVLAKKGR